MQNIFLRNILFFDATEQRALIMIANEQSIVQTWVNQDAFLHNKFFVEVYEEILIKWGASSLGGIVLCNGPGSYTGMRVALAFAKGIAAARNIPIVSLNKLDIMGAACRKQLAEMGNWDKDDFFCPMVDARRMEVFTTVYDAHGLVVMEPGAYIISDASFFEKYKKARINFCGSGALKMQNMIYEGNNRLLDICGYYDSVFYDLGMEELRKGQADDWRKLQPIYLKEFYGPKPAVYSPNS